MNETGRVDLGLGLSNADVEQIVGLTKRGIQVSRSTMYGSEYVSVTWSFSQDDDDDGVEEPAIPDDAFRQLLTSVSFT